MPNYFDGFEFEELDGVFHPAAVNGVAMLWAVEPVSIDPPSGTYNIPLVTLSTATPLATINYTIDGTTPTPSHGTTYIEPFYIWMDALLQAMAFKNGLADSVVTSASYIVIQGLWSAGGNLLAARAETCGAGTKATAIIMGGIDATLSALATAELYNGATWLVAAALNRPRKDGPGGTGTQIAALIICGNSIGAFDPYIAVEFYNGSSWTIMANELVNRWQCSAAGTASAALAIGGQHYVFPNDRITNVSFFNGTTWFVVGALSIARSHFGASGTSGAAFVAGGFGNGAPWPQYSMEIFNGTTWSSGPALADPDGMQGNSAAGTPVAGLSFGIRRLDAVPNFSTEIFDGISWSRGGEMLIVRAQQAGGGAQGTAFAAGGYNVNGSPPPDYIPCNTSEEFTL